MMYLVLEMLTYLIFAGLLGFWIGWQLNGYYKKRKITQLQNIWKANLYSREEELKVSQQQLRSCLKQLETIQNT